MVDGNITFTVDNGRGPITAFFKPPLTFHFCDGNWHEIHGRAFIQTSFYSLKHFLFCFKYESHDIPKIEMPWIRLRRSPKVKIFYRIHGGCSSGLCSTIQIEPKLFDDLKSWDVRLRLCSTENWQLLNIKLIEHNQRGDYVRLILISTLKIDNCQT